MRFEIMLIPPHSRYRCEICDKEFRSRRYVTQHIKVAHQKIREHKCPECGRQFTQRTSMVLHVRSVHQKTRAHSCRLVLTGDRPTQEILVPDWLLTKLWLVVYLLRSVAGCCTVYSTLYWMSFKDFIHRELHVIKSDVATHRSPLSL